MTRFLQPRFLVLVAILLIGSVRCTEVGPSGDPAAIEMAGGNAQSGPVGLPLPSPLLVRVTDAEGDPVENVTVSWSAQGGGSVSAATSRTNSSGTASVQRILGPTPGEQTTTASVSGLQPVTFVATATEGEPASVVITTNPPVSALTGEVFDPVVQPVVEVRDGSGNPAVGVTVTASLASGAGALEGQVNATSDGSGIARFVDLGIRGTGEHTIEFTAGAASVVSSPVSLSSLSSEATSGSWGPIVNWDIVPLHMSLLPSGKIFAWGKTEIGDTMGMPRVWDPAQGPPTTAPMIDVAEMLFCAGHTITADGNLMIAGGHYKDDAGIKVTYFYGQNGSWTKGPNMAHGRWYPTLTVLPDGRVLSMAGRNELREQVTIPEIWENGRWVELLGAGDYVIPYYPRNFVDPTNGLIFYAGERIQSRWFDVDGTDVGGRGRWIPGPSHIYQFNRDYGSAVMYDSGKILYVGGGGLDRWGGGTWPDPKTNQVTATAEIIDLNRTNPTWQNTSPMAFRRRHLNATVLPDGQVLVTGGTSGGGKLVDFSEANAVHAAEMWNPGTGQWTTLASNRITRVYHSVSLLLPDGTVLHGSSGDAMDGSQMVPPQRNHEIFSPPYMFKGVRPTVASAPGSVGYGQTFTVATPNAGQITQVRWIRLGSVTHAFDASARANTLSFTASDGQLEVNAPSGPNLAPPGPYLLFVLNRNGVPSAGRVVQIQ